MEASGDSFHRVVHSVKDFELKDVRSSMGSLGYYQRPSSHVGSLGFSDSSQHM
ncbi:hypothetical protein HAX54_018507, partial [Datura stramonium]|nr:hypothetical protein [Datura stramonium]